MSVGGATGDAALRARRLQKAARIVYVLGAVAICVLSLVPLDRIPFETGLSDKLDHVFAYAVVACAGGLGFAARRAWLATGLGLIALGIGLEILQAYVPGRMPSAADALANGVGVALGAGLARWSGARLFRALTGPR